MTFPNTACSSEMNTGCTKCKLALRFERNNWSSLVSIALFNDKRFLTELLPQRDKVTFYEIFNFKK